MVQNRLEPLSYDLQKAITAVNISYAGNLILIRTADDGKGLARVESNKIVKRQQCGIAWASTLATNSVVQHRN